MRTRNVGSVPYFQLLARVGSAAAALDASPELPGAVGGGSRIPSRAEFVREAARVAELGARHIFLGQDLYPPLLFVLDTAPPGLLAAGDLRLLDRLVVAMVGARNASAAVRRFARELAHALSGRSALVVSGLIRGMDTAAHEGSLAGGIDVFDPP